MSGALKIGILRETKNPPDRRVSLTPSQIIALEKIYPDVRFYVQPSSFRCYTDDEYDCLKIPLKEDLRDCDILMGIKEVDKGTLLNGKTYLFFAHVGKKQRHNREMLREILIKKIRLIDYEYLTTDNEERIVAFGRFAGIVGAYNGLRARGIKTGKFRLKPAYQCRDIHDLQAELRLINLDPGLKVLVTGEGRVANGAMETLSVCNFVKVDPEDFIKRKFDTHVVCQIGPRHYVEHLNGLTFSLSHFIKHPQEYKSAFLQFTQVTDILITGHYWDPHSPVFFTKEDMKKPEFRISVIADISCDINGPVPSTIRTSAITDPYYGYNPHLETEEPPFTSPANITVMAIDNLPGELPKDASVDFGRQLMNNLLNDLVSGTDTPMIKRATITSEGKLTKRFSYLEDYIIDCNN